MIALTILGRAFALAILTLLIGPLPVSAFILLGALRICLQIERIEIARNERAAA